MLHPTRNTEKRTGGRGELTGGGASAEPNATDAKHPLWHGRSREDQVMCDVPSNEEKRQHARTGAEVFQLHVQFLRAHGLPKGEVTTLYADGIFLSAIERHSGSRPIN
jgi:hypothetical protein